MIALTPHADRPVATSSLPSPQPWTRDLASIQRTGRTTVLTAPLLTVGDAGVTIQPPLPPISSPSVHRAAEPCRVHWKPMLPPPLRPSPGRPARHDNDDLGERVMIPPPLLSHGARRTGPATPPPLDQTATLTDPGIVKPSDPAPDRFQGLWQRVSRPSARHRRR
jgi:hypothetical protein